MNKYSHYSGKRFENSIIMPWVPLFLLGIEPYLCNFKFLIKSKKDTLI